MIRSLTLLVAAGCSSGQVHDRLNVDVDGAVLPVEVHGDIGSGTLLLVESGGPSGPSIAQRDVGLYPFQDTLEPHLAIALYDRRGTGNATGDYSPEDLSMDRLVQDLEAVRTVLEEVYTPERLVLMGHSFGGYTSALVQLDERPADAWVAVAPGIMSGPDDLYVPVRRDFACRVADEQLAAGETATLWSDIDAFCDAHPSLPPVWDSPEREELWGYLNEIEDRLEPWPPMDPMGLLGVVFASGYHFVDTQLRGNLISERIEAEPGREDLLPELGSLAIPTLAITGEYDGGMPTELGRALVAASGGEASLLELEGAGHYPMADQPEAFADAVLDLVDGL